jgi:hypothetical protein
MTTAIKNPGRNQTKWIAEGYQEALADILDKASEEGLAGVLSWIENNASVGTKAQAKALRRSLGL